VTENGGVLTEGSVTKGDTGQPAHPTVAEMLADPWSSGRWVIDTEGSRAEFAVKHLWGAATVHGSLGPVSGEASVGADGTITAALSIDAASLSTNNKVRDAHLRSADFFDVKHHPEVIVTVTAAKPASSADLAALDCRGVIEAGGRVQPVGFLAKVSGVTQDSVVLQAELLVDRTGFAMTWGPIGIVSATARSTVVVRFIRPPDEPLARPATETRQPQQQPEHAGTSEPGFPRWILALRHSHDALTALIESLDRSQLEQQSYAPEWSIAQVLSHLGSQAEIFDLFLDAALAGREPPGREAFGPIWDVWNAKSPRAQAAEGLAADAAMLERIETFDGEQLRLPLLGMDLDVIGLARKRLFEHTQHSWDIAVTLNPAATLAAEATGLLVDRLGELVGRAAKPGGLRRRWRLRTTDPERWFVLEIDASATLASSEADAGPADIVLPAEALIRLVCGQLDPEHTPAIVGSTADLDELRAIFPGF